MDHPAGVYCHEHGPPGCQWLDRPDRSNLRVLTDERRERIARAEGGYRVSHDRGAVTIGNEAACLAFAGAQNRHDDIGYFPV